MNIKYLQRTYGTYAVAKYLKSLGYPLFMARHILVIERRKDLK